MLKGGGGQPFSHDISELGRSWHVQNAKLIKSYLLENKVDVQFDVLGAAMMNWVVSQVDCRHVVALDNGGLVSAGV